VREYLSDTILDGLRSIGDPTVDPNMAALSRAQERVLATARDTGLQALIRSPGFVPLARLLGIGDLLNQSGPPPDPAIVVDACNTFVRYGSEICAALLLAGLPEAYAAGRGARFLLAGSQLAQGGPPTTRRIAATAQFVIGTMTPSQQVLPVSYQTKKYRPAASLVADQLWGGKDQAVGYGVALRIMHAAIRSRVALPPRRPGSPGPPEVGLNQEDLLAMLMTFTITVFEVLEQCGIQLSDEQEGCYFALWDHVGHVLGIGNERVISELLAVDTIEEANALLCEADCPPPAGQAPAVPPPPDAVAARRRAALLNDARSRNALRTAVRNGSLRPTSVDEGRGLLARLRERLWTLDMDQGRPPYTYMQFNEILEDVGPGRILLRSLLDELSAPLPASQKTWPVALMRQLVPQTVRDRLALGAPWMPWGVVDALGSLPSLASLPALGGAAGSTILPAQALRWRATKVADTLCVSYIERGMIEIPGLAADMLGIEVRG
jgi:hypothetical protein